MVFTLLASENQTTLKTGRDVFNYLGPLIHLIGTPTGVFALAIIAVGGYYFLYGKRGVELMLFVATLFGMVGFYGSIYHNNTLIPVLQSFRSICRPAYVITIGLMAMRYIISYNSLRWSPPRKSAMAFMALQFLYSLRLILVAPERSFGTILLDLMLFYGLWELLRRSITSGQDIVKYTMALFVGGLAFYGLSLMEIVFGNIHHIVFVGRFSGISQNPQFIGEVTAILIICANFIIISGYSRAWQKIIALSGACFMLPFMLWTGSRTAMGMCAVGLLILYRISIRRWAVFAVVGAVAYELYTHFFHNGTQAVAHLVSGMNDRGAAWSKGLAVFSQHPIFGMAASQSLVECSFIVILAALGSVGLVMLIVVAYTTAREVITVFRNRSILDPELQKAVEFACAILIASAAGMTFDAYLIAAATTQAIISWFSLALLSVAYEAIQARLTGVMAPAQGTPSQNDWISDKRRPASGPPDSLAPTETRPPARGAEA